MKRILTAVVLIAIVVALIFLAPLWLIAVVAAVVAALAAYEYRDLAHQKDVYIPLWWLLGATALIFLSVHYQPTFELPVLTLITFILLAWSGFRAPLNRVLLDTALGLFALIYVVYPLTLLPLIKAHEDGTGLDEAAFSRNSWRDNPNALLGRPFFKWNFIKKVKISSLHGLEFHHFKIA